MSQHLSPMHISIGAPAYDSIHTLIMSSYLPISMSPFAAIAPHGLLPNTYTRSARQAQNSRIQQTRPAPQASVLARLLYSCSFRASQS